MLQRFWTFRILIIAPTPSRSRFRRSGPDLVFGASTCLPFGHLIVGAKGRNTGSGADLFKIAFRESAKGAGDGAVALQQKQRRNRSDAVRVARRVAFTRRIQQ